MAFLVRCSYAMLFFAACIQADNCIYSSYSLFGTKTLYREVKRHFPNKHPRGCKSIGIWMLIRHGARYPGSDEAETQQQVENFAKTLNQTGRATLCHNDLEELRNWRAWSTKYDDKNLTRYGYNEMRGLARRVKKTFISQYFKTWNHTKTGIFEFSSTNKTRTMKSRKAFIDGLFRFGPSKNVNIFEKPVLSLEEDPLAPGYGFKCPRYVREVKENPNISAEYEKFVNGTLLSAVAKRVVKRLGVPRSTLSNRFLMELYRTCYSENFANRFATRQRPVWCKIFNEKDLKILEYASDLEDYPEKSYSFPITYQQNCNLAKTLHDFLKNSERLDDPQEPSFHGVFKFVSSRAIFTLGATFGLYENQTPLTAEGFSLQRHRSFRTSELAPSAANIAFVLYRCTKKQNIRYYLRIFWNEKLMAPVPGCSSAHGRNSRLCDLNLWLNYHSQYTSNSPHECRQQEICA